ncbi:ABC transporter substrate-binding protein [Knoellia koreensis]|uniref:Extracellular solute-binding protein n=1 Tax=Knoellia koreensis TaxID=2730921 RepID=A0A849HKY1_9MICO|nr:extracellular solute-binding protein [Knoellia sp. DB2414S]NNM48078.1 extracellular solute-binding protein [Knoellia sp. DB2414S]
MTTHSSTTARPPHRRRSHRVRRALVALVAASVVAVLAACSGGSTARNAGPGITVWIVEDLPDRVKATQAIVDDFTKASGIPVELVPVAEDQFNQLLISSAAAGDLPDVVGGVPLAQVRSMSANELIDTAAVGRALQALDPSTFSDRALSLTRDGQTPLAVPSETWMQLLFYRADLFAQAGLAPPTSYDTVMAAAKALDKGDMAGFVGATAPGDAFTEQTFEQVALGNNCQLVQQDGKVGLDDKACLEAFTFYGDLIDKYSVPGAQDVDTTRAAYFAGRAAMFIWSTFALDEMAGLRNDAKPNCPQCTKDPTFLAKNTGVVNSISGPSGKGPAAFGEVTSWTITAQSAADPSTKFVEYMFGDGYVPWIGIAPEGKLPVRQGTPDEPKKFADAWATLPAGVDTKAPLSKFYKPEVLQALTGSTEQLSRWAFDQGQGNLLGALQGEQPVATAVNEVTSGTDPDKAAKDAADTVRAIQESLS